MLHLFYGEINQLNFLDSIKIDAAAAHFTDVNSTVNTLKALKFTFLLELYFSQCRETFFTVRIIYNYLFLMPPLHDCVVSAPSTLKIVKSCLSARLPGVKDEERCGPSTGTGSSSAQGKDPELCPPSPLLIYAVEWVYHPASISLLFLLHCSQGISLLPSHCPGPGRTRERWESVGRNTVLEQ